MHKKFTWLYLMVQLLTIALANGVKNFWSRTCTHKCHIPKQTKGIGHNSSPKTSLNTELTIPICSLCCPYESYRPSVVCNSHGQAVNLTHYMSPEYIFTFQKLKAHGVTRQKLSIDKTVLEWYYQSFDGKGWFNVRLFMDGLMSFCGRNHCFKKLEMQSRLSTKAGVHLK